NGNVVEQPARAEWSDVAGGNRVGQYRLRDLVAALDEAKNDSRVKAVALDLDGFTGGGKTAMGDLDDAVRRVRGAGKPVVAYATGYTNDGYQLASAASEVWLNPLGAVAISGPGGSNLYFKGLLDKIGERDAFEARLAQRGGKDNGPGGYSRIRLASYISDKVDRNPRGPIGIVTVAGMIVDGNAGAGSAGGDTIAKQIDNGIRKQGIKALVVRVDSPGGSVLASERIRQALVQVRAKG